MATKKPSYVSRPSQITKAKPTKRLKKRRRKNIAKPRKGFFPNPAGRPVYILTAQGTGKRMHYDGKHFSERARVKTFPSVAAARETGLALIKRFPILRKYKVRVESNFR